MNNDLWFTWCIHRHAPMQLTGESMIDEQDTVQENAQEESDKVAMAVVSNTTSQPHAMMVKP